jgi:hypothetical protein
MQVPDWKVYVEQEKIKTIESEYGTSTLTREQLLKELFKREAMEVFPLEVFPLDLHHYIQELTERLHIPREFVGLFLMAAGGAAVGSYYMAEAHTQRTFPTVWACAVGESSSGKSFVIDRLFEVFEDLDMEMNEGNYKDYSSRKEAADMAQEDLEMDDYEEKTIIFKKGTFPAFLQKALKTNPKGVILWKEELVSLMGEFNKKNNEDFEPFLLEAWNAKKPYKMDKLSSRRTLIIPRTFTTLIGTIQPTMVRKLFANDRDSTGFTYRFLFALDKQNKTLVPDIDFEPDREAYGRYENMIKTLYTDLGVKLYGYKAQDPQIVRCDRAAIMLLDKWKRHHKGKADALKDDDAVSRETYKGAFGKLGEYAIRFALILKCMDVATTSYGDVRNIQTIEESVMARALLVTDYFLYSYIETAKLGDTRRLPEEASILSSCVKRGMSMAKIAEHLNEIYGKGYSKTNIVRKIQRYRNRYPKDFLD